MKKLLNKKGFTTVELIVVIALMALMLAIVIPMLSTADARKNEVREYARSFYSNVQELMIDEKLAKTPLPCGNSGYVLVCAKVDRDDTTYNGVKVWMSYASDPSAFESNLTELVDTTDDDDKVVLSPTTVTSYDAFAEFATSLRRLLLGNERTGWYYAIVDSKYRVVSTYFVEGEDSDFSTMKNAAFDSVNVIGETYAGAWPEELAEKDKLMFSIPA